MCRMIDYRKWLSLALSIVLNGCSNQGITETANHSGSDGAEFADTLAYTPTKEDQRASELFQAYDRYLLDDSPMLLTSLGKKERQSEWDDFSTASYRKAFTEHQAFLAKAKAIDVSKLGPSTSQSLEILKLKLHDAITGYEFRHYQYPFNPMFGVHNYLPTFLMNDHAIDNIKDAEAYLSRLETIGKPLNDFIETVKENAQAGITAPKFTYPLVLLSIEKLLQGYPLTEYGEHPLTKNFQTKLSKLSLNNLTRETLFKRFNQAMLNNFKPSYEDLRHFITEQQQIASKDLGVHQFKGGLDYYQYRLNSITTTDMSAEDIHQLGLAEVSRIHKEMKVIMQQVGFKGTLLDFFAFTRDDQQFRIGNSSEERSRVLAWNQQLITNMKNKLPEAFNVSLKTGLEIKAVESFREKSAGLAFYQRPGIYSEKPGIYYLNLYKAQNNPNYIMPAMAYHEGIPGHHFQLSIQKNQDKLPLFQRIGGFIVYTEGWALYAETLAKDLNMYKTPYEYYGHLVMDLKRAIRLVIDTGLHAKGWSMARAIHYRVENSPSTLEDSRSAVQRFLVIPGQAVAYTIGKAKILSLKSRAQTALGSRFDLADFHDQILTRGSVPLSLLESNVQLWIEKSQKQVTRSSL